MDLRLRVGLNSGRVIAGEIGSGPLGYAATGETVGFALRVESVAPGAVMLSESTAQACRHTRTGGTGVGAHQRRPCKDTCAPTGGDQPTGWRRPRR